MSDKQQPITAAVRVVSQQERSNGSESNDHESSSNNNEEEEEEDNNSATSLTRFPLPSTSSGHSLALDQLLFFLAGIGSSLGYISSLSALVFFQQLFGNDFFVSLNLAVYVPLVPIAVAQALWDQQYDQFYATRKTFCVRGVVAFALIILGTMGMIVLFAKYQSSLKSRWVLVCAFLQGMGGAILYGQLNQLASFMTKNGFDGGVGGNTSAVAMDTTASSMPLKFKATVSAGVQASALVALVLSWTSGFRTMNSGRFTSFLWSIMLVTVLCFGCLLWLLLANRRVQASMIHRDSSIQRIPSSQILSMESSSSDNQSNAVHLGDSVPISRLEQPLLRTYQQSPPAPFDFSGDALDESLLPPLELSVASLWTYTKSGCYILAMTLVPSFLVGSWFTHIKTTTWMELPQILFYVRIGMDFLGRLATLGGPKEMTGSNTQQNRSNGSLNCVFWTALVRWGIVALFFFNASVELQVLSGLYQDAMSIGLVATIAFLSGYLVTSCYQVAPLQLPEEYRATNATKQASLLTVAFAVSAFAGLLSSIFLATTTITFFAPSVDAFVIQKTPHHNRVRLRQHPFRHYSTVDQNLEENHPGIGVGIDLGTTNSAIAFLDEETNEPTIIEIPNNGRTMPSVVVIESNGEVRVGKKAIDWEDEHQETAYRHVKRILGTSAKFLSTETKQVVPHLVLNSGDGDNINFNKKGTKKGKYKNKQNKPQSLERMMQAASEDPAMLHPLTTQDKQSAKDNLVSPEMVSACILQKLLQTAEEYTKHKITRAVIGVPAYFNDAQRDATTRAANACGIEKVKLLREPEAAALVYGVGKDDATTTGEDDDEIEEELVLVFDLGGGTYDVSVLLVEKGLTEIVCTSGNAQLGGTNFDAKIAKYLSSTVVKGCAKSEEAKDMILRAAERIRIYLSNNKNAELALPLSEDGWIKLENPNDVILPKDSIVEQEVDDSRISHQFSRKDLEQICADEFQELLRPIREVAIMAGALLPGDARPGAADSALEIDSAFNDFYSEDDDGSGSDDSISDSMQEALKAAEDKLSLKSSKKAQQKGRKKAREVAKQERKYRAESRKAQEVQPVQKVQADGISGRPLSRIVLVGGATRMPTIGRILSSLTGVVPQKTVDPDEAVALGCAVHVGVLDGNEEMGVVLSPMQAALLRAVVEKERREGQLDDFFDKDFADEDFADIEYL